MKNSIVKTVGLVMILTLTSRFMALLSQQIYITKFGITRYLDIYIYCVNFQVTVINVIGTTIITVMIPLFTEYFKNNQKLRAFKFADNLISLSVIFTVTISIIGITFAPIWVKYSEFKDGNFNSFALTGLRIMFPVLVFYALTFIFQGLLQAQGRFIIPAMVSLPYNIIVIVYTLFLGNKYGIIGLLIATLIGLSSQAVFQIPSILKTEYRYHPSFCLFDNDIKGAFRLIPPILINSFTYQVNVFFNLSMASKFDGGISYINIGQQLALVIIQSLAISLTSVMFPILTTMATQGKMYEYKDTVLKILKNVLLVFFPLTIGMAIVSKEIITFIFGYGKFSIKEILITSSIFSLYSLGGIGVSIKEVIDKLFYSLKETKKPAIIGIIMMITNIICNFCFIPFIGLYAIPLSYSIAILTCCLSSILILRRRLGAFGLTKLCKIFVKVIIATLAMSIITYTISEYFKNISILSCEKILYLRILENGIKLAIPVLSGLLIYILFLFILKVDEVTELLKIFSSKFIKRKTLF